MFIDIQHGALSPSSSRNGRSLDDALTQLSQQGKGESIVALMKSVVQLDGRKLDAQKYTIAISACGRAKLWQEVPKFQRFASDKQVLFWKVHQGFCTALGVIFMTLPLWFIGNHPRRSNACIQSGFELGLDVWVSLGYRLFQYPSDPCRNQNIMAS